VQDHGRPIQGVAVELHSTPQRGVTDKTGTVHFKNVAKGDHMVLLAYHDHKGSRQITLSGDMQEVAVTLSVQLIDTGFASPFVRVVVGILAGIIVLLGLIIFSLAKRKSTQ
jgi:hypothetical protein